jgi:lipoprotein-releasing system ATP-binding protein
MNLVHAVKEEASVTLVDANLKKSDCILQARNVRKSFLSPAGDKIEVLRDLSFSAVAGETVAIVGASGAGKSTLLHLLGGLEAADQGTITLNGVDLGHCGPSELASLRNRSIGFMFQFHHLLPDLSAVENVAMPLMIERWRQKEAIARARRALESLGLSDRLNHAVTYLSGGEQQRVAIARALITEPQVVLADEPTGNLDRAIEQDISQQLLAYARDNEKVVIIATHNEQLSETCDRVLLLKNGTLE